MPDDSFLHDLYSEPYFDVSNISPELTDQVGILDVTADDHNRRKLIAQNEINSWRSRGIPSDSSTTIKFLEVGGGRGYLQQAASEKGWETLGIELSRYAIKSAIASGLPILPITLGQLYSEYIPYTCYFDVVALFDFLEHVTDPGQVLRVIRDLLKKDGILVLRLPVTIENPELHLIDHIWHFTTKTMDLLFLKERFQVVSQHDSGTFFSLEGKKLNNTTIFLTKRD